MNGASVEPHRNQNAPRASERCFLHHVSRGARRLGPAHHHGFADAYLAHHLRTPIGPRIKVAVKPLAYAQMREGAPERFNAGAVLTFVGDENVGHGPSCD